MSKFLDDIMRDLFHEAEQRPGQRRTRKLKGGLHVTITMGVSRSNARLEISRDRVYPSEKEWDVICKHFPYYIGVPKYDTAINRDGRMAFAGNVPSRGYVAEKLL